jgi:hypothetical protein
MVGASRKKGQKAKRTKLFLFSSFSLSLSLTLSHTHTLSLSLFLSHSLSQSFVGMDRKGINKMTISYTLVCCYNFLRSLHLYIRTKVAPLSAK